MVDTFALHSGMKHARMCTHTQKVNVHVCTYTHTHTHRRRWNIYEPNWL